MAMKELLLVVVLVLLVQPAFSQDPYTLLGVDREASDAEIKRAFKKLARKHHPDALKGDLSEAEREGARKRFMELSTAYETLTNPEKKKALDEGRQHSATDRNYLRYNLFNDDFTGAQAKSQELRKLIEGKAGSGVVFFWSPNYPDCIESGLNFKKAATSLDITDVTVFSFKCDDDPSICHEVRLGDLPAMLVFTPATQERYHGKYEPHSIVEFALEKSSLGLKESSVSTDIYNVCPNPEVNIKDPLSPFFLATTKRCTLGSFTHEFVTFEYSPCYDCEIETKLARGLLGRVLPNLVIRRMNCRTLENEDFCEDLGIRERNKAWAIASVTKRCWYAMKRPYIFSHEECEPLKITKFTGRYKAWEFARFTMGRKKSHALKLTPSDVPTIKTRDTAYAILFHQRNGADDATLRWSFLAREMNTISPVTGRRGFPLKLASIACESAGDCDVESLPVVQLYGYGQKVKKLPPVEYSDLRSLRGIQRHLARC